MSNRVKITDAEREERAGELRKYFPRAKSGSAQKPRAYLVCTDVSRSGMGRTIKVLVPTKGKRGLAVTDVSHSVAMFLERRFDDKHDGVRCEGCGMDMGFELIYALACKLYGARERGGYAIEHVWL